MTDAWPLLAALRSARLSPHRRPIGRLLLRLAAMLSSSVSQATACGPGERRDRWCSIGATEARWRRSGRVPPTRLRVHLHGDRRHGVTKAIDQRIAHRPHPDTNDPPIFKALGKRLAQLIDSSTG
jgi:hypothetical protein